MRFTWIHCLSLGLVANLTIWGAAWVYITRVPRQYTSEWTVLLPPSNPGTSVSLDRVGQAQVDSGSAFGIITIDPRETYRVLSTSNPVMDTAAKALNISERELDRAVRVTLPPNTGLLQYSVAGPTPEMAKQRAEVLYQTFVNRVQQLRNEEQNQRNRFVEDSIASDLDKLNQNQAELSRFKARTGLFSSEQLTQMVGSLETLRQQQIEASAQAAESRSRQQQLAATLGLQPEQANRVFLLRGDQTYQESLAQYSKALAQLDELRTTRGDNHPTVQAKQGEVDAARATIERILGQSLSSQTLQQFNLGEGSTGRAQLLTELITQQSEMQGQTARVQELNRQIARMEERKRLLVIEEGRLARLNQQVQLGQVVLSSTAGSLALSRTDVPSSYPLIQLVVPPSLPSIPSSPRPLFAVAGAGLGSLLVTVALLLLWRQSASRPSVLNRQEDFDPRPLLPANQTTTRA